MCCLFGFIDYNYSLSGKQKNRLLRSLASAAEERGTDAAGIAYHAGGKLHIMKKAKPAHVLRFRVLAETSVVMGHTRYATQGDAKKAYNAHPFQGQIGNKKFALAHNMELCHEAGLYQIDLLNGSANRVTEREYWAKKKGQAALDQENAALAAEGKPTKPTRFETDKEKLRQIIRKTLNESFTVEDFTQKLLQYGVTVKESRGRLSYLTPDRTKPITARKLGDSFDKAAVLAALEQNALRSENTLDSNDGVPLDRTLSSNEGASDRHTPKQSAPQTPSIGRMVDREAKRTEGKGIGYDRWASMHNLKAWSKTFMYLQEHDLLSPDKLSAAVDAAGAEAREARSRYDAAAAKVTDKKAMLEAMDNYRKTYPVIKEYRAIRKEKDRQKFYAAHEADFIINDAAKRQLDKLGAPKQLPKRKEVVAEIQSLISEKNECYNDYREKSDRLHELMTMQRNYQMAIQPQQPKHGRKHEQEL